MWPVIPICLIKPCALASTKAFSPHFPKKGINLLFGADIVDLIQIYIIQLHIIQTLLD